MRFRTLLYLSFILICATGYSQEQKFFPIGHFEALGSYSAVKDGQTIWGGDVFGYYSPIIKLSDSLFLIPLYTTSYQRMLQFLAQEEGTLPYSEYMTHNLNLALRKEFKPGWFIRGQALGTWNFINETRNESWGKGLYDYRDVGGSIDLSHKKQSSLRLQDYGLEFEYYRRTYPNFQPLAAAGMPSPPERHEKDFDGYKLTFSLDRANVDGSRLYIKPYYLYKRFTDKHLINSDGTYDFSQKRQDHMVNLDYGFRLPLGKVFSLGMDNNYAYNNSNLGYYDSRNSLKLTDDVFTPDYYSYHSASIYPYVEYTKSWEQDKDFKWQMGYSYLLRYYPKRKAQNEAGTYKVDNQRDLEHTLYSSVNLPLTRKIDWLLRCWYTWARSNQDYELYYRYKYETYVIQTGFSLDF